MRFLDSLLLSIGSCHLWQHNVCILLCSQGAIALFEERMQSLGIAPETATFNALIRAVGRSRRSDLVGRAAAYFSRLCELGLQPDKYTFSALFNTAYHCKLLDGAFLLQASLVVCDTV